LAARYVETRFRAAGLEPQGDAGSFYQTFPFAAGTTSANVIGRLAGRDKDPAVAAQTIVIGAHHDHLGMPVRGGRAVLYPGADDNASGTAVLLELARAFAAAKTRPRRPILFVAFGAEEPGPCLWGSRHYVAHPPVPVERTIAMINIDMVGRGELLDQKDLATVKKGLGLRTRGMVGILGAHRSPDLREKSRAACARVGLGAIGIEDMPGALRPYIEEQTAGRGDFAPFEAAGIPYLFFSTSESDDYHRPTDVPATLDFPNLRRIAAAIALTVAAVADADRPPARLPKK
jgi:Zn-dependent M28 family amino/carboxypeptidase